MENVKNILEQSITGAPAYRRQINPSPTESIGRVTPQAVDLEEAVLGGLMLEKSAVNEAIDILTPESFYMDKHSKIFTAIVNLFQRSEPIDILTVTNELRSTGELDFVGGPFYISQLTNRVASTANIEFHARIIVQKHILRELIRISSATVDEAFDETIDVFDLLDKTESQLYQVSEGNIKKRYESISNIMKDAIDQIEKAKQNEDGLSGVPSGFDKVDRITGGWQKSDLLILAARPGMGKTAFVLSMARNMAVQFQKPTVVFSLEMSSVQLVTRLIASESGLSSDKLRKGTLEEHEWAQLNTRIKELSTAPLYIDDTPALSIFELRAKCRRLKQQFNVEFIIIDYLQLMTAGGDHKGGNREQEISTISRSLKSIAKELDVPVMALSQLSRAVETRGGDKRPQLSDLRESGAIEQDADMVMFLYRPEYYGMDEDAEGNSTQGLAELIIAKHRNGALEDVPLRFISNLAKFDNLDEFSFEGFNELGANESFDNESGTKTIGSKMNELPDNTDFDSEDTSFEDDQDIDPF